MTEFTPISRDRVSAKLLDKYDCCANKEGNDKVIDTPDELCKFMKEAELSKANRKISKEEYDQFLQNFTEESKLVLIYSLTQSISGNEEEIKNLEQMIAQLEKDVKNYEDYQKENPNKSMFHNVLNKGELCLKGLGAILVLAVAWIIPGAQDMVTGDFAVESLKKTAKQGTISSSEYNQLRSKADYETLNCLKVSLKKKEEYLECCKKQLAELQNTTI